MQRNITPRLTQTCNAGMNHRPCIAGLVQPCINVAPQGQDYVSIRSTNATLRQDAMLIGYLFT